MESCFCLAVIRRLVLVGLITDDHSEGHGVTPIDLSTKQRQPQANHFWVRIIRQQCTKDLNEAVICSSRSRWLHCLIMRPD